MSDFDDMPVEEYDVTGDGVTDAYVADSDDDGVADGREGAGVVTSFAGGILTVRLASGGTATAVVDGFTDVRCPTERGYERGQHGAAKALRRSGRKGRSGPKRSARRGARDAGRVHARPAQEPDEEFEDEVGVEEGWSDEIEWTEEDGSGDEEVGDDSGEEWSEEDWGGESTSACLGSVKRGTPVHASAVDSDAEGSWFVAVALVR